MNLSFWELKNWFWNVDYTIVGSGIVGLHAALQLRNRFPESKILIIEKGMLPQGASTKNAGFACFGSISEIIDDLNSHSEEDVIQLMNEHIKFIDIEHRGFLMLDVTKEKTQGDYYFINNNLN